MKCLVCGNELFTFFHKGTRDNEDINVMKCARCGSLQLSTFSQIYDGFYEEGNMRRGQYIISGDTYTDQVWASWVAETKVDDCRRADQIRKCVCGGGKSFS